MKICIRGLALKPLNYEICGGIEKPFKEQETITSLSKTPTINMTITVKGSIVMRKISKSEEIVI